MCIITLNEMEVRLAKSIAKLRYESNRNSGVPNQKIGPQDNWTTDLDGAAAEIAVAKLINVYPDLSISVRHGGYDLITSKGNRIDVKQTSYKNGRLICRSDRPDNNVDIYILCIGTVPIFNVRGWAWKHELVRKENLTDLGRAVAFALSQDKLHKDFNKREEA